MIECLVRKVPFPAYETFFDRRGLPRRYYLFFEKFYRAGRHNKELWNAAITREKGNNDIPFGTCIFEAHVRTTLEENYFSWMFNALSSPKVVPVLYDADDFQTEYDCDVLPRELACNHEDITSLPVSCEYRYNEDRKRFDVVSGQSRPKLRESFIKAQRLRLQELVDSKKQERQETLKTLRKMVNEVRKKTYTKEQRNELNIKSKKMFRLFMEEDAAGKENVGNGPEPNRTTTPPPSKKQKRPTSVNKCRIPEKKLDLFRTVKDELVLERDLGIQPAWERLYKKIRNKCLQSDADKQDSTVNQSHFLGELGMMNNWKTKQSNLLDDGESYFDDDDFDENDYPDSDIHDSSDSDNDDESITPQHQPLDTNTAPDCTTMLPEGHSGNAVVPV